MVKNYALRLKGALGSLFIPQMWWLHGLVLFFTLALLQSESLAESVQISEVCRNSFRKSSDIAIEGAVVTSQNERNVDCVITFRTNSILQHFMLRFEKLELDCNDHLYIYESSNAIGSFKKDVSCEHTAENFGIFFTKSNFLTLKFVTGQWDQMTNGFRLIITAFTDRKHCNQFQCDKSNLCIDRKLTCDGVNHCEDGSDESPSLAGCPESDYLSDDPASKPFRPNRGIGLQLIREIVTTAPPGEDEIIREDLPEDGVEEESVAFRALKSAVDWTRGKMNANWGWGSDTPNTVLALALANSSFFSSPTLEARLMMKEYELYLVLQLWKHKEAFMTAGHVALNVMVLIALCQDPRNFYSKDLIAILEHKETGVDFELAFSALASCSAGKHVRKSKVRKLLDIILDQNKIHSIDTLSVVILALHCSQRQRKQDLSEYISESVNSLLLQQMDDGSFSSNLHTTAIALQAMAASGLGSSWNATRAFQYVMSHQLPDGSFGNIFDTNAILPILGGNTFLNITDVKCRNKLLVEASALQEEKDFPKFIHSSSSSGDVEAHVNPTLTPMINMTYIIWIGDVPSLKYNMTFSVPQNTTFLEIMKLAAEENDKFQFSASKWANGYYIHTLAGQKEKQVGFWFWLLYRLREPPVPGIKPDNKYVVALGVQELIPNDGDYILFWYHKI